MTVVSQDGDPPCDRPNLSKDYLAGTAPEAWIPLRDEAYYRDQSIDLRLGIEIRAIDAARRTAISGSGEAFPFDRLDRKSVVQGKSVSVRLDLGGRRIIKKKKQKIN